MADITRLISVFEETRMLLSRPDNDFIWSSWEDEKDALEEIDGILAGLRSGFSDPLTMRVLFAPTGPIQEVAISSGWGNYFLELADRFDEAMAGQSVDAAVRNTPDDQCCSPVAPRSDLIVERELGMDRWFSEITLLRCPDCGRKWLRYFFELEATTGSGRWYLGAVPKEKVAILSAENAKEILEGLDWYFYGGSYYQGMTGRRSGAITLDA
jgi:hypothetical protein